MATPDRPQRRPVSWERSAGGLVVDDVRAPTRGALIGRIHRRDKSLEWVLPKGHVEPGEDLPRTAEREVAEETGLQARVVGVLGEIEYWFVHDGQRVHKTVTHYVLAYESGSPGSTDPEVDRVAWFPIAELAGALRYDSEADLLTRLPEVLGEGQE